jgi:hypothetical protein
MSPQIFQPFVDTEEAESAVFAFICFDLGGIESDSVVFDGNLDILVISLDRNLHIPRLCVFGNVDQKFAYRLIEKDARFVREGLGLQVVLKVEYQSELFLKLVSEPLEGSFQPFFIEERCPELKCQ